MFIGSDKISETMNDSDSDGGNFSELSDRDTCKVNMYALFLFHVNNSYTSAPQRTVISTVPVWFGVAFANRAVDLQ